METREGMLLYIKTVSEKNKWILNKDKQTLNDLLDGLIENKKRYGYQSCPCRLASGVKDFDRDLICPCQYAPVDVKEYGACYCNLYLKTDFYKTGKTYVNVPERRPIEKERAVIEYFTKKK